MKIVSTTEIHDRSTPRSVLVAAQVDDQPVDRLETGRPVERELPPNFQPDTRTTREKVYEGEQLVEQTTTLADASGAPLITVHEQRNGTLWVEEVQLHQREGEGGFRKPAARGEISQAEIDRANGYSVQDVLAWDQSRAWRVDLLKERYGHLRDAGILELGPFCTSYVARALLTEGSGNSYTGVDANPVALQRQREVLEHVGGYPAAHSRQVVGHFLDLPLEDRSQDLVVAYASFEVGARSEDAIRGLDEVHRVLKPGGEFLLEGWTLDGAAPATVAHLLDRFEVVGSPGPGTGAILRKR